MDQKIIFHALLSCAGQTHKVSGTIMNQLQIQYLFLFKDPAFSVILSFTLNDHLLIQLWPSLPKIYPPP